jgi:hypothetical protein
MAIGPGKYDDEATEVRTKTLADGVLLLVINGAQGSGFSAQLPLDLTLKLPQILRDLAKQIDESGITV